MAYKPRVLAVAEGGTSLATLTAHALYVGNGTTAPTALAVGSTGQVLQGNSGADPSFSTATFPSTATGTGKILRANGTNWVASTATYPDTASTSGNVLTSDGTNFASSAPSTFTVSGQLTNSQIKALHATPIQIIATPGSNKLIQVISWAASYVYGGTNAFTAAASQTVSLYYSTTVALAAPVSNAQLVGTASTYTATQNNTINVQTTSNYTNLAINFYNPIATEITGNAGNNNLINWSVTYTIIPV